MGKLREQKLVIIRDDVIESLRENLIKFATLNRVNDRDGEQINLNLGEATEKSLLDDNIHELSLSLREIKKIKTYRLLKMGLNVASV